MEYGINIPSKDSLVDKEKFYSDNNLDNSIFLESEHYRSENKNLMDQCFENLFDLAYNRLKEKLDIYNYRDLSLLNFEMSGDKINPSKESKESLKFEDVTKVICSDLDKIINSYDKEKHEQIRLLGEEEGRK